MTNYQPPSSFPQLPPLLITHLSPLIFGFSGMLIVSMFYFLAQIDHPTIILLRSFEHPLLDTVGEIGNHLGDGVTLVVISLTIGGIGYVRKSNKLKMLSFHSLLAHGIAGLFTQILKHSLGRPRPRHMDKGPWEIGPSFESGYNSFPSGHTSASFAVATILAYYFPKWKFLWFGLAAFAGMCRVTTGSHYPTDVLGGLLLGMLAGLVLGHAKSQWQEIGRHTLAQGVPWLITGFGLVWILVPHPEIKFDHAISLFLGLTLIIIGFVLRLWWIRKKAGPHSTPDLNVPTWPRLLMGFGLATSTGSLIIVGVSLLAGIIWWLGSQTQTQPHTESHRNRIAADNLTWTEVALAIGMFLLSLMTVLTPFSIVFILF